MPNFTFQTGLLEPVQAALRVVKYFGKPHLSFSLKRLSLGKQRRAEQPAQSWRRGEGSAALLAASCAGGAGVPSHPDWGVLKTAIGHDDCGEH